MSQKLQWYDKVILVDDEGKRHPLMLDSDKLVRAANNVGDAVRLAADDELRLFEENDMR